MIFLLSQTQSGVVGGSDEILTLKIRQMETRVLTVFDSMQELKVVYLFKDLQFSDVQQHIMVNLLW